MKKAFLIALAMSFVAQFTPAMAKEQNVKLYVSLSAESGGDGSIDKPFKTLNEARDAIRAMKKEGKYPESGVNVMVREGNYFLLDSLTFTEEDSGEEGAPVIWSAYPGEDVKFIGGAELKLSDFSLLNDASVMSKMDSSTAGKIYHVNLEEKGVQGYDQLYVTGHASHYTLLYGITEGNLPVPELYLMEK